MLRNIVTSVNRDGRSVRSPFTYLRFLGLAAGLLFLLCLMLPAVLTTASAASPPACATTFLPESAGNIPTYFTEGGLATGSTIYWNPNWDDTYGWVETEGETPVWVDLNGGWNNGIPTLSSTACITSGTLPLRGPTAAPGGDAVAGTLEISAGAELDITADSDNNASHLVVFGDIYNAGTIDLNNWAGELTVDGTLHNSGVLSALAGEYSSYIYGNVDNIGTFNVNGSIDLDRDGSGLTFTNSGTVNIAAGQTLDLVPADPTTIFALNGGGTISNNGTFFQYGGTFKHNAGNATGNPLVVDNANLAANPASGSASFTVDNGTDTLTGDVGASETITLSNSAGGTAHGDLTTASGPSVTNYGAINLGSGNGLDPAGPLTNAGTITDTGAGVISGDISNSGTINTNGNLTISLGSGNTFTNTGSIAISSGNEFSVSPADTTSVFDEAGGVISNSGTFAQYGGTFEQTGGDLAGYAPVVNNADLAPSDGLGMLLINNGTDTLTSNIGENQTMVLGSSNGGLNGGALESILPNLTNAGYIELTASNDSVSLNNLTNNGVVQTLAGGTFSASTITNNGNLYFGGGTLNGNLNNEGTFDVTNSTSLDPGSAAATITDGGTVTIDPVQTLTVGADTFVLAGGTITNNGTFSQNGGTFNHTSGSATGNPLGVSNATLSVTPASGSAAFNATNDTLTTDIGGSETLNVGGTLGNGSSSSPTTNNGVLNLDNGTVSISQLDNVGTLTATDAQVEGLLSNEGGAIIDNGILTVQTFDQYTGTTAIPSDNEFVVTGDVNYYGGTMTNAGDFGASGTFALYGGTITNNGNGAVTLSDGTFQQVGCFGTCTGGVISGAPVYISQETLKLIPLVGNPAGSVSFVDYNGTSTLIGGIPAGDAMTISTADPGYGGGGVLDTTAFTNAGTITFIYDGELHNTGVLTNTGTINVEGSARIDGALTNAGTINANPLTMGLVAGPGELMMFGNFIQTAAGTLEITVAPDEYTEGIYSETFYVEGTATLAGALILQPDPTYAPLATPGDIDPFFTYTDGGQGVFSTVTTNPALGGGLTFSLNYTYSDIDGPGITAVVGDLTTPYATAPPTVSGITVQGQTLSETHGIWLNSPTSYSYQWQDCDTGGNNCVDVAAGGIASTYLLGAGDVNHTIRVVETASNGDGPGPGASSAASTVVTIPAPAPAGVLPAISGSTVQGQVLNATSGSWTNSPSSYSYQWLDCNAAGTSCSDVAAGGSSAGYTLTASDVGHTLRVEVVAHNGGGDSIPANSLASALVTAPAPPPPGVYPPASTTPPTISGTATQGQSLTESHGVWSNNPTSYSYQWQDCNAAGGACANISGATSASYTLMASDVGHTLRVIETAGNSVGSASAASAASAVVAAPTPPPPAAPNVSLVSAKVNGHAFTAKFKAAGKVSGFQCALVVVPARKGAKTPAPRYVSCHSPKTYRGLRKGKYVFYVRAFGPGGTGAVAAHKLTIK